jgi:hypothetical protein
MQLIATIDAPVVIQRIDPPAASYLPTVRNPIGEHFSKVVDQGPIGTPDTLN